MSKEKQIEEMAKCCTYYHNGECCADVTNICDCDLMCEMFGVFANLEKAGYRKQSEGSNISGYPSLFECSVCHWQDSDTCMADTSEFNYCPNCGARMKGENK